MIIEIGIIIVNPSSSYPYDVEILVLLQELLLQVSHFHNGLILHVQKLLRHLVQGGQEGEQRKRR